MLFHVAPHPHLPPYSEGLHIGPFQEANEEDRQARALWAQDLLAQAHKDMGDSNLAVKELFVVSNHPHEAIIETAKKLDCDLIVMAPHGTHYVIGGVLLGSETQKVLTHAKIPVLVVRESGSRVGIEPGEGVTLYRAILVATDGSEYSAKAVKHAALLAKMSGAKLVLFHAAPQIHVPARSEGLDVRRWGTAEEAKSARDVMARRLLAASRKEITVGDVAVEEVFVASDHPYEAILEEAKKNECDLIVMAPHGHHGIAGILLGSETQKVLTHAGIPVLIVR